MTAKKCIKCNQTKPIDEFYKTKRRGKVGVACYCKRCEIASSSVYQKANLRKIRLRQRRFTAKKKGMTPHQYDEYQAAKSTRAEANKLIAETQRTVNMYKRWMRYGTRNPAAIKWIKRLEGIFRQRAYKRNNPDAVKAARSAYQAKKRANRKPRKYNGRVNPDDITRGELSKKAFRRGSKGNGQHKLNQRTPRHWQGWKEMRNAILDKFHESIKTSWVIGIQFHVDHIIPLNGTNVSGLHVPSNLRILTADANQTKGSIYTP